MKTVVRPSVLRCLGSALLVLALGQPAAYAAVTGSYQGIVDDDSGLGLMGQAMRVDFIYDETVAPSSTFSTGVGLFENFLQSMTVTVGGNVWQWGPNGYSSIFLTNDSVQSFSLGVEDSFTSFIGTFNGPSLVGTPVDPDAYSLDIYFTDNQPTNFPDALNSHTALPAVAPNPDLFRVRLAGETVDRNTNVMYFSFFTGNGETGQRYSIQASSVTLAAPVPEPTVSLMLLAGLGVLGAAVRARQQRRS
jgi:hypothetical protein